MRTVVGGGEQGENENLKCVLRSEAPAAGMMLGVRGMDSEERGSGWGCTLIPGQEYMHRLGTSWVLLEEVGPGTR